MSKARRRLKARQRAIEFRQRNQGPVHICTHCGQRTDHGHFAPPGLGSPGVWVCEAPS